MTVELEVGDVLKWTIVKTEECAAGMSQSTWDLLIIVATIIAAFTVYAAWRVATQND